MDEHVSRMSQDGCTASGNPHAPCGMARGSHRHCMTRCQCTLDQLQSRPRRDEQIVSRVRVKRAITELLCFPIPLSLARRHQKFLVPCARDLSVVGCHRLFGLLQILAARQERKRRRHGQEMLPSPCEGFQIIARASCEFQTVDIRIDRLCTTGNQLMSCAAPMSTKPELVLVSAILGLQCVCSLPSCIGSIRAVLYRTYDIRS